MTARKELGQEVFIEDGKINWSGPEVAYNRQTRPNQVTLDGDFELSTLLRICQHMMETRSVLDPAIRDRIVCNKVPPGGVLEFTNLHEFDVHAVLITTKYD